MGKLEELKQKILYQNHRPCIEKKINFKVLAAFFNI